MKKYLVILAWFCMLSACSTSGVGGAGQVAYSKIHSFQAVECTHDGGCYPVQIQR